MAVAKLARRRLGWFAGRIRRHAPSLMRSTVCYISTLTAKLPYRRTAAACPSESESADPHEVGQVEAQRQRRARAFARLQGHPGAGRRAVLRGGGPLSRLALCRAAASRCVPAAHRASRLRRSFTRNCTSASSPHLDRASSRCFDVDNLRIDAADGDAGPRRSARHRERCRGVRCGRLAPVLSNLIVDSPTCSFRAPRTASLSVAGVPIPTSAQRQRHVHDLAAAASRPSCCATVRCAGAMPSARAGDRAEATSGSRFSTTAPTTGSRCRRPPTAKCCTARSTSRGLPPSRRSRRSASRSTGAASAYLSTGPVDLPMLARYVKIPDRDLRGRIDNAIWLDFADGKLQTASGELTGNDIALRVRPTQPRLELPIAQFGWTSRRRTTASTRCTCPTCTPSSASRRSTTARRSRALSPRKR